MRCPECAQQNGAGASACNQCGLLLLDAALPKRRREDASNLKRRSSDLLGGSCPFCQGSLERESLRCRHCEILGEEYRVATALRRRARINHASWVVYLFGMITVLFLPAAGLIAIGAGLLLSVSYYALPVEKTSGEDSGPPGVRAWLVSHLPLERTSFHIPHLPRMRLIFVGTPLLAIVAGFLANFFLLQYPMNRILHENPAFSGMRISTHYQYWIRPGVVVYDLKDLGDKQSRLDVHTALLEYAKQLRDRSFQRVELMYRGKEKFLIPGPSFRRLGDEYQNRNFNFVLFQLPRMAHPVGESAADAGTGREALIRFHDRWYADDMRRSIRSVAPGEEEARSSAGQ